MGIGSHRVGTYYREKEKKPFLFSFVDKKVEGVSEVENQNKLKRRMFK